MRWQLPRPESLFARLFLAMLSVVAATLLIVLILILRERHEFSKLESDARTTAQNIARISQHLAQLSTADRVSAIESLKQTPALFAPPPLRPRHPQEELESERVFVAEVKKDLGKTYGVSAGPPRPMQDVIPLHLESRSWPPFGNGMPAPRLAHRFFDLNVRLPDGEQIVYRTSVPRPGPQLPPQIFFELGTLTLVLGVVLYFMTRTITRPLAELERAANAVGRGVHGPLLKEKGARELRGATRAFNAMQDRVRRYLDSRTRVLAAMSHDLRTPLTRLRLRVESIDNEALRLRCSADLEEMSKMINGALALFRGLNDEEPWELTDVDALLSAIQLEFKDMQADVAIEGRSLELINAQPLALKRCLANLLQNAVQYGTRARVVIEDGRSLVIRVQDAGPGIPEEAMENVFEPFYRLEASRNRDSGGTGLGLSIARNIAQAHGGSLILQNMPQGGLEAVLQLPRDSA